MWLGGTALWIGLLLVGTLVLALRFVPTPRLHLVAMGGILLVLIAAVGVSTASGWGWPPKPSRIAVPYGRQAIPMPALEFALRGSAVRLRATEFAFRPSSVVAAPGVPLALELINSGSLEHTIVIPALGVQATLLPAEHRIVHVGSVGAGTYEFFCAIPAHRKAGMTGQLVVAAER
jgi:plastocyanin